MAAATDVEDLMTCGVCVCEYDEVDRKPKFLQCAHTVCLLCLKKICQGDSIKCPFCRETSVKSNVESLPNNPYALHMLKFKENKNEELPKPIEVVTNPYLAVSWCLTCGSAEKLGCAPSGHSSVDMTADAIRSLEGLLKSKEELMKMKDIGTNQLTMAIEERQKVQEQLSLILKAIQHSEEEIKKLQDENNYQMIKMISILERSDSKVDSDLQDDTAKKELFFSELMSLVDGSTTEDTPETLKQKMQKSIKLYEQKLCEASAIASEYEFRKKAKIAVFLYDENDRRIPTFPWLEWGFRFQPLSPALKVSQIRQDSLLVSNAVFSLLKNQKFEFGAVEPRNRTVPLKSDQQSSSAVNAHRSSETVSFPPSIPSSSVDKFVLDNSSVFILRMFKSGSPKGEIVIRPVLMFEHRDFMQKLGDYCFRTQKIFCNTIDKAVAGVYVAFPMCSAKFQPSVPSMARLDPAKTLQQETSSNSHVLLLANQVRIALVKTSSDKVTGWTFVFPLEEFQNPKFDVHVKQFMGSQLFGRIASHRMMEAVTQLSLTKKTERTGYMITLESQCSF